MRPEGGATGATAFGRSPTSPYGIMPEEAVPDGIAPTPAKDEASLESFRDRLATIEDRLAAIEGSSPALRRRVRRIPAFWRWCIIMTASAVITLGLAAALSLAFLIATEGDMR